MPLYPDCVNRAGLPEAYWCESYAAIAILSSWV